MRAAVSSMTQAAKTQLRAENGMPEIKPDFKFFPFMPTIQNAAGGTLAVVFILAVIAIGVGGAVLMFAKISDSSRMSEKTIGIIVWIVVIAAIVGVAAPLVGWAIGALAW